MQVALFKARRSISISNEAATEVVNAMDTYLATQISQAIQPVLGKLDSSQGKLDSFQGKLDGLQSKLDSFQDKLDAFQSKLDSNQSVLLARLEAFAHVKQETEAGRERRATFMRWMIGISVAASGTTIGVLRALGWL